MALLSIITWKAVPDTFFHHSLVHHDLRKNKNPRGGGDFLIYFSFSS